MLSRAENEMLCRTGPGTPMGELVRRFWRPARLVPDLPEPDCEPVRLKVLGENLVAFRDTNGKVGVLERQCPHRLADMWFGRNENAGLACAYHGWKFDVDGNCMEMPTETAESSYKHKVRMISYPTQEYGGVVWVYMGPAEQQPELPQMEWCRVPDDQRVVRSWLQDSNYMQATEGEIDSAHISFNHRWMNMDAMPAAQRTPQRLLPDGRPMRVLDGAPRLTVKETDYGFTYGSRREVGEGQYYWRVTQFLLPFYSMIPGPSRSAGSGRCWVPVDDEHNMVFQYQASADGPMSEQQRVRASASPENLTFQHHELKDGTIIDCWRPQRQRGNDYLIDRRMQKFDNYTGIASGREQDMAMTDGMGPIPQRWREHLGTTDIAIITARKILLRLARELQEGREPFAPHHGDAYRVRPIDIVSDEADFVKLYDKHADLAMAKV